MRFAALIILGVAAHGAVGSSYAVDYMDVDIDLLGYNKDNFCNNCNSFPEYDGERVSDRTFYGKQDVIMLNMRLSNLDSHEPLDLKSVDFTLNFEVKGKTYKLIPFHKNDWSTTNYRDNVERSKEWSKRCPTVWGSFGSGDEKEFTLCFIVPDVRNVELVLFSLVRDSPSEFNFVALGPTYSCDNFKYPRYCSATWDLSRERQYDGLHTYTIEGVDIYERHQSGYGELVKEAVKSGLDAWSNINTNMRFQYTNDPARAEFKVIMGGTGEEYGSKTDTFGSVNEIGCLRNLNEVCTITMFLEDAYTNRVNLMSSEMIEFVIAHEVGHLFGLPHHASALHLMYSPLDRHATWYEDSDYGLVVPDITNPNRSGSGHTTQPPSRTTTNYPSLIVLVNEGASNPDCRNDGGCISPRVGTVTVGDTVGWRNNDLNVHWIVSGSLSTGPDGTFDSGPLLPTSTFSHRFTSTGSYPYLCLLHPWISGVVIATR